MNTGRLRRALAVLLMTAQLCAPKPLAAQAVGADAPCAKATVDTPEEPALRRPGQSSAQGLAPMPEVECHPERMPAPPPAPLPPPTYAGDRWRLIEQLGRPVNLGDPYDAGNPLKGDRPIFGKNGFTNFSLTSNSLIESRRLPTTDAGTPPVDGTHPRTASRDEQFFSETVALDAVVYRGDTVFRPPDWQFRFTPTFNLADTRQSVGSTSTKSAAVQALWFEKYLRDASVHYDFDSVRFGIQPLTSDSRGFLLLDQPAALRFFGTRANNVFQYNVVLLERIAKDTARLNDLGKPLPNNPVLLANLYWQDAPFAGSTSEFLLAHSHNRSMGTQQLLVVNGVSTAASAAHDYDVTYLGYGLDGHVGRLNTSTMFYDLTGREQQGTFVATPAHVQAWFGATELSADFDWWRMRLSALHASGDDNPYDDRAGGFDTLNSSPIFAGSDSSYFLHQRLALAGGVFDLKSRDSLLPGLRATADPGQANFTNPGLDLVGLGFDLSVTPKLTLNADANQLWFDRTAVLEALLQQSAICRRFGAELDLNAIWRPLDSQNLIVRLSGSYLIAQPGLKELYDEANPFSVFALITLNY